MCVRVCWGGGLLICGCVPSDKPCIVAHNYLVYDDHRSPYWQSVFITVLAHGEFLQDLPIMSTSTQ